MADIPLGEMLTSLLTDLSTHSELVAPEAALRLRITEVDLAIPAYLRLQEAGEDPELEPARVVLTMPSTRESPRVGSLGRIAITIDVQVHETAPAPPSEQP